MKRLTFLVCFFVVAASESQAQPLEIQLDELVFTGSMAPDIAPPVAANSFVISKETIEKKRQSQHCRFIARSAGVCGQ